MNIMNIMNIEKCGKCGNKIYLYAEHTHDEMVIVHCQKPDCNWKSLPIQRHLTIGIKEHKDMKETWN